MATSSAKGSLPYGWIVKTSKKYPDRVYYFNVATGASTWECPDLDPPRLLEDKEELFSGHTSILNKSSEDRLFPPLVEPEYEQSIECRVPTKKTLLAESEKLSQAIENNKTNFKVSARDSLLPIQENFPKTLETSAMYSQPFIGNGLLPLPDMEPMPCHTVYSQAVGNGLHTLPVKMPKSLETKKPVYSKVPAKKCLPPLPEQAKKCGAVSNVAPRKRKLNNVSSAADTLTAMNPPTAIVAPVVLEKASTSSSSLPPNRTIKFVCKNQRKLLKKQNLSVFTSNTQSSSKGVKQHLQVQAGPSSGHKLSNKPCISVSVQEGGSNKANKKVIVPSRQSSTSASASSSESYDTDLDMNFEIEDPLSVLSSESSSGTSILREIQSNPCEDIEMLDVSADLTKIDDLAVPAQVADDHCSYYIVIDTNVLIDDLNHINEIKDTPLNGCGPPHIFIPWIVIEELDALKRSPRTSVTGRAAQHAVRYLNKVLKSKHPRFHGQSPQEAEDCAKVYSKCNDDKILECCMSLAQKMPPEKVILLTNDKNLINKALICDIVVHSWDSLMKALKPDSIIKALSKSKKKKRRKNNKNASPGTLERPLQNSDEQLLNQKLEKEEAECQTEIHSIMSEARQLLKDVLESFLTEEMNEAYGDPWNAFPIDKQLLKGLLDAISKYWRSVFALHFSEKDKRNFELLREKVSRPTGFLGDREDCLSTLTTIEDVFCRIKRRLPQLQIPAEKIEDLRLKCIESFKRNCIDVSISQIESVINVSESESVLLAFENAWTVINHLCGMVMDFYRVQHNFVYDKPDSVPSEVEFRRLMINLYPCVQNIKKLMLGVVAAIKNNNPRVQIYTELYKALNELVPTLQIQANNPSVPNFNPKALERFCRNPENTERVQLGCKQIELFFSKLDHAVKVMSSSKLDKGSNSMSLD